MCEPILSQLQVASASFLDNDESAMRYFSGMISLDIESAEVLRHSGWDDGVDGKEISGAQT